MGRKISEKILKILLRIILIFIAIDLFLVLLLFVPPIQKLAVNAATNWLSNTTGSPTTIEKIYLTPLLDLKAKGVCIMDHQQNPMIAVDQLVGNIKLRKCSTHSLAFGDVRLKHAKVILRRYNDGKRTNISEWSRGFKKSEKKKERFLISFEHILLKDSYLLIANDVRCKHFTDNTIDYANLEFDKLVLDVDDFLVDGDDISCKINQLSFQQYTGFVVQNMHGDFRINNDGLIVDNAIIMTDYSKIDFDFAFRYDSYRSYSEFVDSVYFDVDFRTTQLDMQDVQFFVPSLKGMDNKFVLNGRVTGPVQDLYLENFYVKYRAMTQIMGDFALRNVIDFKHGAYKMLLKNSNVYMDELADFKLPGGKVLKLPHSLTQLGNVQVDVDFESTLPNLFANVDLKTKMGNVLAQFKTSSSIQNDILAFSGNVRTSQFNVGGVMNQEKLLGNAALDVSIKGSTLMERENKSFLDCLKAEVKGVVKSANFCHYNLKNISFEGVYHNDEVAVKLDSPDENCNLNVDGKINFSGIVPQYVASLSVKNFEPYEICKYYPYQIDTANAKGVERLILLSKNNPTFNLVINDLDMQMEGNQWNNMMGYLNADKVNFQNNKINAHCEWIHFLSIDPAYGKHNYVLSTDFMDMNFSTNHSLKDLGKVLKNYTAYYFPQFVAANEEEFIPNQTSLEEETRFIDLSLNLEYIQSFLDVFMPKLKINSTLSVEAYLTDNHSSDNIEVDIPSLSYNDKLLISQLYLKGNKLESGVLDIVLDVNTLTLANAKNYLPFHQITLKSQTYGDRVSYDLSWISPETISKSELSQIKGYVGGTLHKDVRVKVEESAIYIKDTRWSFIGNDEITIAPKKITFDYCVLAAENIGSIALDGSYSTLTDEKVNVMVENVDLSLLNSIIGGKSTTFGGNLSAIAFLKTTQGRSAIVGKIMATDFEFNKAKFGNLFLLADAPANEEVRFFGGFYQPNPNMRFRGLQFYNYADYQSENKKLALLSGSFNTQKREFDVKANIDTLPIGFLKPFLSSFSDDVYGDAYGALRFVLNKDSLYFDGDVMVREGFLNIAPLNTLYKLENQKVSLNPKGIFFDRVRLRDKDYNSAYLNGAVYHNRFRDFRVDLHINTDRILALNTPKTHDVSFCGDGYVSGDISIVGDGEKLAFYGDNLKTLSGSQVIFPVSSASKVSVSDGIKFTAPLYVDSIIPSVRKSSTEMDFDFTFDVTPDASVRIDLDAIDGTLACKTMGKLRLTYNSTKSLNLDGALTINSGSFKMSLKNLVPREFDIVEGGLINFTGPLSSSLVNVSARYDKSASLNNLSSQLNIGRTEVNAYLHLNGPLLNPQPSFSFAFPKLNSEEQTNVYAALDTSNTQNVLRQFFSLVFFNSFVAGEAQTANLENQGIQGGIGMVADVFNNFISQQFKNFDLGLNYYSSDDNYREYSVNASIPLYNDRILVKTRFGLAENVATGTNNNNNIVGDVSFEYKINEAGNWVLRLFYFNDQYELNQDASRPQQGGGVALIFQQEFNGKRDLVEEWKLQSLGPVRRKKNKRYD